MDFVRILLTAIALILVIVWSWLLGIRFAFGAGYTVTLNTTAVTEAQVRGWLNDAGYQELTGLAEVTVVDEGYTASNIGGGTVTGSDGVIRYFASPASIQFNSANLLSSPWYAISWEYGHVWSNYFLWTYWRGNYDAYLIRRGIDPADPRLGNYSSCWNPQELAASDYWVLFGHPETAFRSGGFAPQCGFPEPYDISGFRDWYGLTFTQGHPPPGYGSTPATPTPQPATATPTRTPVATPTMGPVTLTPVGTCTPPRARRCR